MRSGQYDCGFRCSLRGGPIPPLPRADDSASVRADPGPQALDPTPPGDHPPAKGSRFMASIRPLVVGTLGALALAVVLGAPITVLRAQDSDPVVARANGVDIRQSDLALAEEEVGANIPQMAPEQKREYLLTYLADVVVLAQAAQQQKLADRDDVKHRIDFARNKVLMEALLQDVGQAATTDE